MSLPLPSRRAFVGLTAALTVPLALAACGGGDGSTEGEGSDGGSAGGEGGFPVTVRNDYGEITLEKKPERVVAIGGSYTDQLIALGVQPVAYVGSPRAGLEFLDGYPWFADTDLDPAGHDLALLAEGYTPSLEAIAALEPDLIIGDAAEWAIDEAMYEEISLIAPTYATWNDDQSQWVSMFTDIAALTGTSEAAETLLGEFETQLEESRERLAGMQGATYVYGDVSEQELRLTAGVYMLEEIGLVPDEELAARGAVSLEELDAVTSDVFYVMVWRGDSVLADLEADPRFGSLPAVQNGAFVPADATLTNALEPGPLAFSWWLDQVVGTLEGSALNTSE
jgi:iron complex transport system substrate-binding protein